MQCEQVAALPWRMDADGKVRILMITSRTNRKWMLPKGWPISGKAPHEAALIEAQEEAGIDGQASPAPIGSYHYIKLFDDGRTQPSQAQVYPVKVTAVRKKWDEKKQRDRQWLRPKKASDLAYEPDLKRFLLELNDQTIALFHRDSAA